MYICTKIILAYNKNIDFHDKEAIGYTEAKSSLTFFFFYQFKWNRLKFEHLKVGD